MKRESYTIRDLFFRHIAQTSSSPLALEIERAEGVFLFTPDNRKIIDLVSGVCVSNIGHGNKEVLKAVKDQIDSHMHLMVYGEIVQRPQSEHAALLTSLLDSSLDSVYYLNSGSEANEVALKLAKRVTGKREIISFVNGYHGGTHGALSVMGNEEFKSSFRPLLPGVRHIRFNNFEDLEYITERCAAVIVEPVMAEAGVISPINGYLKALRERCNETGTLLILDEIQTGFGRTGELFAHQKYGVVPDILTLAKALGGGMPLGAVVASSKIMSCWQTNPVLGHITTFGGHPVCCAAALAALQVTLDEHLHEGAHAKGELFKSLLKHPKIKEVRGLGLMLAAEMESFEQLKKAIDACILEGVVIDWFLFCDNSMRLAPPLTITEEQIRHACSVILKVLDSI